MIAKDASSATIRLTSNRAAFGASTPLGKLRYDRGVNVETQLREALEPEARVVCAWLFGSIARGTSRAGSDVDVAIIADVVQDIDRRHLQWDLEARLSAIVRRTVQVVAFDRAPADLARRILRDGHLLLDRDRARRIAAEVRKRSEYFDMTPTWRRIRRLPRGVAP